ncbi:hypothetical protein GSS88_06255 [Corynebacterium sp. 3HC-13]|uniref:trypsin-like serine protease n=1 Tax=Corynebacterium poyangense TaxID=2684405 RepID=UPI001CCF9DFD|nr:trypsin-like serine protease [Corynebacterium poyangense]MBZ8177399.1 hypothetical protein [Corynebacterium poyangense]
MLKGLKTTAAAAGLVAMALATPVAHAAVGGDKSENNPGIVALTDGSGNQVCTAVMVDSQWALTFEGPMTCSGAVAGTADSHDPVSIDRQEFKSQNPEESQAMLVHFAEPVQRVTPAKLSTKAPEAGETLKIAAYNGEEGINHLLSIGTSDIKVEGHNVWLSWYGAPESFSLETGKDSGAPIMRGNEVVGFTGLVTEKSADAEDIANVYDWVQSTIH